MSDHIQIAKVEILIQQKRFADAERILRDLLAVDSNNTNFMVLLAELNLQQDKADIAMQIIDNAIGLAPDDPHLFYVKSRIFLDLDDVASAEKCVRQALSIDPNDADYYALLANIRLSRKQYDEALEYANKALEIDPENIVALNTRSTSLIKLNKSEEAFATIEGALREDPNNTYTHANFGWGLLEKNDPKKALEHFKESLKSNPNNQYAQAGMMEALKATNPVYRIFLKYAFWMGNLTAKYQWGVIIGFYLVVRVLRGMANSNPSLQPFLSPIIFALFIFAFSTWIINPISNLFLRFNVYGRMLLDKKEKMSSNLVAVSLLIFLIGIILLFATNLIVALPIAVFGFAMMVPLSTMFSATKYKNALVYYTIAMAALGLVSITTTAATGEVFNNFSLVFLVGFIAFQFIANFMVIREDNR